MTNPPPLNLLQLQFGSIDEFKSYWSQYPEHRNMMWRWHETIGDHDGPIEWTGICDVCMSNTVFTVTPKRNESNGFVFRTAWSNLLCRKCNFNAIDRNIISYIKNDRNNLKSIYHVGYHSSISVFLSRHWPKLIRSQYAKGVKSGFVDEKGIRYEDLNGLSFSKNSFDYIVCSEILEHIPDYKKAIQEMYRVLKPGGKALLTFPWLGGDHYDHRIRAELLPDGTIKHILPPEYHMDPASKEGILSFRAFGWVILDELRSAGFRNAEATHKFGPLYGYMTMQAPLVVATK